MIFSRIGSQLSRSSRFRNVYNLSTTLLQIPKLVDFSPLNHQRRREGGNTDNNGSSSRVTYLGRLKKAAFALFVIELLFAPFSSNPRAGEQISYQEFKNKLLKQGLVDCIVVSNNFILNKSVAKVNVRSSPQNQSRYDTIEGSDSETPVSVTPEGGENSKILFKYYFNIGSVDSFEEKLDKAQEAMGIDPNDYVPVTYVSEIDCHNAIMLFCLFIWLC